MRGGRVAALLAAVAIVAGALPVAAHAATPAAGATRGARTAPPKKHHTAFNARAARPATTSASPALQPAVAELANATFGGSWSELGPKPLLGESPAPASGRVTAVAVSPANTATIFAGTAGGGVWKSTDSGATWAPLTDGQLGSLAIGALAVSADGQTLFAGTGEDIPAVDAQPGVGIYRSTDGGTTWTEVKDASYVSDRVSSIAIDRTTSGSTRVVYAATDNGLWKSADNGATWTNLAPLSGVTYVLNVPSLASSATKAMSFIVQDVTTATTWWGVISDECESEAGQVVVSTDNGISWTTVHSFQVDGGAGGGVSRIGFGVGPGGVAYATPASCGAAAYFDAGFGQSLGIFKLTTTTVTKLNPAGFDGDWLASGGYQGWYDNEIAVDPADPTASRFVYGGVEVWASADGGSSVHEVADMYDSDACLGTTCTQAVHPDTHAVTFVPGTGSAGTPSTFLLGTDGGVFKATNLAASAGNWSVLNGPATGPGALGTLEFYAGVALDGTDFLGGAQDNGTAAVNAATRAAHPLPGWQEFCGGDGMYTAVDTVHNQYFCEYSYGTSTPGGMSWGTWSTGAQVANPDAGPCETGGVDPACADSSGWVAPFVQDVATPGRLWAATTKLYRSTWTPGATPVAGAAGWVAITPDLSVPTISGHPEPESIVGMRQVGTADTLVVTTADQRIFLVTGAAGTATIRDITGNYAASGAFIFSGVADAAINPANPAEGWVASAAGGSPLVSHSTNLGNLAPTWSDISSGLNVRAVNSLLRDPLDAATLYAGTDRGVWACTQCGGATPTPNWLPLGLGLPNAWVDNLTVAADGRHLVAWTHGRGAWQLALSEQYALTPNNSQQQGGVPFNVTLTAMNGGGTDAGYTGTVHFTSSDAFATLPADYAFTPGDAGTHTFSVTFNTLGGQTLTATDTVATGVTATVNATVSAAPGVYRPLTPYRLLDTRAASHVGQYTGAFVGNHVYSLHITGTSGNGNGVPASGVTAVVLNVTVGNPSNAGYLTLYPHNVTRPNASNINFAAGQVVANLVQVAVDAGGQIDIYNFSGTVDVVIDVAGYFAAPADSNGLYNPITPTRFLDTRPATHVGPGEATPFGPGEVRPLSVTGGPVPAGVTGVVLNVTVGNPTSSGYLTLWPADAASRPVVSNINFVAGQVVANRVYVRVPTASGTIDIYNFSGFTDVVVDVAGYFTSGSGDRYFPLPPARIIDTRPASQVGPYGTPLAGGQQDLVTVAGAGGVPASGAEAVVADVAVTDATASSYLTVYPADAQRPTASDLNWTPGETVPALVVVKLSGTGQVNVYDFAGSVDFVFDVQGYYAP